MPLSRVIKVKDLGVFARFDGSYPPIATVTVPVANGLVADKTLLTNFNVLPVADRVQQNFQSSSNFAANDVTIYYNGLTTNYLQNKFVEIKIGLEVSASANCIALPILHNGYTGAFSFCFADTGGAPSLISGYGYGGGQELILGNQWSWIHSEFIFNGFIANMGNIGIYRNIAGAGNGLSVNFFIRKYFIEIRQINL